MSPAGCILRQDGEDYSFMLLTLGSVWARREAQVEAGKPVLGDGGGTEPVGKDKGTPSSPLLFSSLGRILHSFKEICENTVDHRLKEQRFWGSHTTKNIVFKSGLEIALNRHLAAPTGRSHYPKDPVWPTPFWPGPG